VCQRHQVAVAIKQHAGEEAGLPSFSARVALGGVAGKLGLDRIPERCSSSMLPMSPTQRSTSRSAVLPPAPIHSTAIGLPQVGASDRPAFPFASGRRESCRWCAARQGPTGLAARHACVRKLICLPRNRKNAEGARTFRRRIVWRKELAFRACVIRITLAVGSA